MPIYGQALTIGVYNYNNSTGAPITGDAANMTIKLVKDGTEATSSNSVTEVDSTNMKGWYKLVLTSAEMTFNCIFVGGVSTTTNSSLIGPTLTTDQGVLPGGHLAGASGGLLISGSNAGTTTFGALTVTGAVTLSSTLSVTDTTTLAALTTTGTITANALTVTNATTLSGAVSLGSTLSVAGVTTFTGNVVFSDGIGISRTTANASGITIVGNGTGHGVSIASGSGATGDGLHLVSASTNGNGLYAVGSGTGNGISAQVTGSGAQVSWPTGAIHSGTVQSGSTSTTLALDTGAASTTGAYIGGVVVITQGTGIGLFAPITGYNPSTKILTISGSWPVTPDTSSFFNIYPAASGASGGDPAMRRAIATGGTINSIALDAGASTVTGAYLGAVVTITGGTGVGQQGTIIAYNTGTKTATIIGTWPGATPDATSAFAIYGVGVVSVQVGTGLGQLSITSGVVNANVTQVAGQIATVLGTAGVDFPPVIGSGSDPWATLLPGAYTVGQAGYITGNNLLNFATMIESLGTTGTYTFTPNALINSQAASDPWAKPLPGLYSTGQAGYLLGQLTLASIAAAIWNYSFATFSALANTLTGGWIFQQLNRITPAGPTIQNAVNPTGTYDIVQGTTYTIAGNNPVSFILASSLTLTSGYSGQLAVYPQGGPNTTSYKYPSTNIINLGGGLYQINFELSGTETMVLNPDASQQPGNIYLGNAPAYDFVMTVNDMTTNCFAVQTGTISVTANTLACFNTGGT